MFLEEQINSLTRDSRKAVKNCLYSRTVNLFSTHIKETYREHLSSNISLVNLLRDNMEIVSEFVETKLDMKFKAYTSYNTGLVSLITFYRYLAKRHIIEEDYLENIVNTVNKYKRKPPPLKKKDKYIQSADLHRVLAWSKKWIQYQDPLRFKMVVFLVYYTGIRRIELESLKRSDFDLEKCSVRIKDRVCYYPPQIRDMIVEYFNSEKEIKNAFNFTNAVAGRFNHMLSRYKFRGERITLDFLRDANANLIMKKTKNLGLLMKLHGQISEKYIKMYELKDEDAEKIYKRKIHYYMERR